MSDPDPSGFLRPATWHLCLTRCIIPTQLPRFFTLERHNLTTPATKSQLPTTAIFTHHFSRSRRISHSSDRQHDVCVVHVGRQHEGTGGSSLYFSPPKSHIVLIVPQLGSGDKKAYSAPYCVTSAADAAASSAMQRVHSVVCGEMMTAVIDLQARARDAAQLHWQWG
jgi:hypothetical protein